MSNADDNQGRRGLFRRNRPTEPVASAPLSDTETQNPETAVGRSMLDADRKQGRRPGLGRRKPAADGSWSSDAWEDGWDDDWSDRSSRAGVRPAADPRPAEVDAWLASSDDQLGDITRDIARKWTGNKQTEPVNAAITWADDVPTVPSRSSVDDLVNDPFADDPFANDPFANEPNTGQIAEPTGSFADDDDLWETSAASADWSSAPNDASDPNEPVHFADDDLPIVRLSAEPINLGSTWDDVETSFAADEPVELEPKSFNDPVVLATPELAEQLISSGPDARAESHPEITPSFLEAEVPGSASFDSTEPSPIVSTESGATSTEESGLATNTEESGLGTGTEEPELGTSTQEPGVATNVEESSAAAVKDLAAPAVEEFTPQDLSRVRTLDAPTVDEPKAEILTTDAPLDVAGERPLLALGTTAADPASEATFVQGHLDAVEIPEAAEIPETVETITAPIESVVAPLTTPEPSIEVASAPVAEPEVKEPTETQAPQEFAAPPTETAEINPTQPVERDEFLDSLYEELDDDDVPAQRKVVRAEPSAQTVSLVAAEVKPLAGNQAIRVDAVAAVESAAVASTAVASTAVETTLVDLTRTDPAPLVVTPALTQDVNFAPVNHDLNRQESKALNIASAEPMVDSETSLQVPQDPNADYDFGPDRPVYAPKVSASIVPALIGATAAATTAAASQNPVVQGEDDDLFPATKADRFGVALDQLDDDHTNPSGLQEPAKKGFLRRKNRKALEADPVSPSVAVELDEQTDPPLAPRPSTPATSAAVSALRDERIKPANQTFGAPETEDDLADLDEYDDDLDDYPEEAYFSPKLTKLLARAGFLLVALAAIRMLVLVGLAVRDGASDSQGIQDVFHRIGSAFAELGLAHGLMLIVGIAMAAAPALLADPYIDDESRSIGATFGIGLIAAIFGVFGGFAAARLAMRVNEIADLANPGVSSTTRWAKLAMNLVATAGLSLVAVVAAVRALGGDRPEED